MRLEEADEAKLAGEAGAGVAMAMRLVVAAADWMGADSLLDIEMAHIDGCLYHGEAGLEYVQRLRSLGARVAVPTTLNVTSIDLLHPELTRDEASAGPAREQADAYLALGCRPTWTCSPYQLESRPRFGQQIAWGESNAIVFANSVIGARTERYGDFLDIACAVSGRAPAAGLHLERNRVATVVVEVVEVPDGDMLFPVLGHLVGAAVGDAVPVFSGIPAASEDQLKALGAAAASSGSVGMFHVAGVTPESPSVESALGGETPRRTIVVDRATLRAARRDLGFVEGPVTLGAVSVGTPHYSFDQASTFASLLSGRRVVVPCYLSTGRGVLEMLDRSGVGDALRACGVQTVTDTCTYFTPIIGSVEGVVLTDSAKWAYYGPAALGVEVALGSMVECAEAAATGIVDLGEWPHA